MCQSITDWTEQRRANPRTPCSGAGVSAHLAFLGGVLAGSSVGGHGFPGDDHHTAGLERDVWEPSLDVVRGQLGDGGR